MKQEIHCVKYNHTLDPSLQNFTTFLSRLTLSEDGQRLLIYNLKPKYIENQGCCEAPKEVADPDYQRDSSLDEESSSGSEGGNGLQFQRVLSSSSCNIDDIKNFIVGGMSSRFWMLRKHINSLPRHLFTKLPFYAWNCITL